MKWLLRIGLVVAMCVVAEARPVESSGTASSYSRYFPHFDPSHGRGLDAGTIIGIILGCVLGLGILIVLRTSSRERSYDSGRSPPPDPTQIPS